MRHPLIGMLPRNAAASKIGFFMIAANPFRLERMTK